MWKSFLSCSFYRHGNASKAFRTSLNLSKFRLHTLAFVSCWKEVNTRLGMREGKKLPASYLLPTIVRTNWAYRYSIYLILCRGKGSWRKCRLNVKAINLNWVRAGERKIYWSSEAKNLLLFFFTLKKYRRSKKLINYLVFLLHFNMYRWELVFVYEFNKKAIDHRDSWKVMNKTSIMNGFKTTICEINSSKSFVKF